MKTVYIKYFPNTILNFASHFKHCLDLKRFVTILKPELFTESDCCLQ